jgi:gliding motility-associated-like protein/uncharacterized repeat protein (TIGR01451 family)
LGDQIITQPAVLNASVAKTNVTCNAANDGTITVSAPTGGYGTYEYRLGTGTWQSSGSFTGLAPATYSVQLRDMANIACAIVLGDQIITQPAVLNASVAKTNVTCFAANDGTITVSAPTGGYGTYEYRLGTGTWQSSGSFTGLAPATYNVQIRDKENPACAIFLGDQIITQPAVLNASVVEDSPVVCFGQSNGSATVTPAGGNGGYTYSWDNGETTATATALNVGSHDVTVTDAKGCVITVSVTISQPEAVVACSVVQDTAVTAKGLSDGKATVTPTGGNGGFTFLWDNNETTAQAIALSAGLHNVTVTDSKGCTSSCSVTIREPDELYCLVGQDDPAKCYEDNNGSATVTAFGGNVGYTYLWDNGETTAQATALTAGLHSVTVTDNLGYETTCEVTIQQPTLLTASAVQVSPVVCFGESNGSATVTPTGGNGTYTYLWDNGETTATANALDVGSHDVTVTDVKGCEVTVSITISQPEAVVACSVVQDTPVTANGLSDGIATVTPTGGNGEFTFLWDNGETTAQATALSAGLHNVTVTDSKRCTSSCSVTITEPNVLSCSIVQNEPAKCYGDNNGIATVTPSGGNVGYSYLWDNGETTAQATALTAGLHSVTVTDNLGYETTCEVTIEQPQAALSATAVIINNNNCVGCANGSIVQTVTGGTLPYTYSWSSLAITKDLNSLPKGTYSVEIKDANGCSITKTYTINESGIALVKKGEFIDTNNDGYAQVGEKINYTFLVTNIGNVPVSNVVISDPLITMANITGNPIASLAAGETNNTVTGTYTLTQADVDLGIVINSATALGKDNENKDVTDISGTAIDNDTPTETPLTQISSIVITKDGTYVDTNNDGITNVGDNVVYNFVVTNTGNVTLTNVTVSDPVITITGGPIALAAGASDTSTFSGIYAITQADIDAGVVYNLAIVSGNPPIGEDPTSNSSTDPTPCTTCPVNPECPTCTITPLIQNPVLEVIKTATVTSNGTTTDVYSFVGDIINYTIEVKNLGNVTIYQIVVTDPLTGLNTTIESLAPGESYPAFSESYTITKSDLANDSVTNTANANGKLLDGTPVNGSDTVEVEKASVLGCESVLVHNAFSPNGDGINELFVIDGLEDTICYPENTVEIYNRWGVLVFETRNYNNETNAFNGYSNGRTTVSRSSGLPTGTYFYILNYTSVDLNGDIQANQKDGYLYLTR